MFFVFVPPSIYPLNQKVEVRGGVDGGHNKKSRKLLRLAA